MVVFSKRICLFVLHSMCALLFVGVFLMVVFQRFRTDNPTESPGFETDTPVSRQAPNDSSGVGTSNSEGVTTVSPGFVIGTRTISPGFETVSPATGTASAVSSDVPIVIATLKVTNGGWWGAWGSIQLCPAGSYAVGYDMRIEPKRDSDCTALNAIKLLCEFPDGKDSGEVTSAQGPWGTWVGRVKCTSDVRGRQYLTSFALQVEKYQGQNTGDTAANYVKFSCRDRRGHQKPQELVKSPGAWYMGYMGRMECLMSTGHSNLWNQDEGGKASRHIRRRYGSQ